MNKDKKEPFDYPNDSIKSLVNESCWQHVRQNRHHPEAHLSSELIDKLSKLDEMPTQEKKLTLQHMCGELDRRCAPWKAESRGA